MLSLIIVVVDAVAAAAAKLRAEVRSYPANPNADGNLILSPDKKTAMLYYDIP